MKGKQFHLYKSVSDESDTWTAIKSKKPERLETGIDVIEYSAYEALEEKLKLAVKALEYVRIINSKVKEENRDYKETVSMMRMKATMALNLTTPTEKES